MSERNVDQELLRGLDDRAASAAADLRSRAAARPAPAFDPERPMPLAAPQPAGSRTALAPRRLLAAAAVLVLVAGAASWWTIGRDDHDPAPTTTTTGGLQPYVATDLPDGLVLGGAYHLDEGTSGSGSGSSLAMAFYGPSDGDPEVGVVAGKELTQDAGKLGDPVELPDGRVARPLDATFLGSRSLLVTGRGDPVVLTARSQTQDELLALAAGTAVRGGRASIEADALPDGWRLLVTEPNLVAAISPLGAARNGADEVEYGAYYAEPSSADESVVRTVSVTAVVGDEARLAVAKLLFADVHAVDVGGHPGLAGTMPAGDDLGGDLRVVTWAPTPGTIIRLTATSISEDDLVRVARSVRPATRAAFAELERQASLGELDSRSDGQVEIGRGTFADGTEWVLRSSGSEGGVPTSTELSVSLADGSGPASSGGSSSSGGDGSGPFDEEALRSVEVVDQGGRQFGSGLVADAVTKVELRRADGSVLGSAQLVEGAGAKAWVAELTEVPTVVVALDATGKELGSQRVTASGDGSYDVESPSSEVPATPGN